MWTDNLRNMGQIDKLVFTCLILVLASCQSPNEKIKKVIIKYLPEETTVMIPVTCDNLDYIASVLLQTKTVTDSAFLEHLNKEVNKLKPERQEKSIDIRIKLLIEYESRSDTLCLGEFFDTILNGNLMEDNPRLLELIKSEIY
ncbi:MAG: hypothetical protein EA341_13910 [Mongoliibacter sp.]|nr:MAG: hypothetical protein EA341_13910 [Mongoliibacter sp.]